MLFQEAREAFIAGDYATACPKYEEVVKLRPGLGARIGLGDCYRKMGRLARAWEVYRAIANDAPELAKKAKTWADGSTARKRGQEAETRLKELEPHLGWITIAVPAPVASVPSLVVHLDGAAVEGARLGARLPAEKGDHVVDASAPGKKAWEKTVGIAEGAELTVTVPALEEEKPPPPVDTRPKENPNPSTNGANGTNAGNGASGPTGPRAGEGDGTTGPRVGPDVTTPIVPKDGFFSTQRAVGLGIGIAGLAAGGVGAYFGLEAMRLRDESEKDGHCEGNVCDPKGLPIRQESYKNGNLSTGFFIGGGIAFATGFALFLTAPKRKATASAIIVTPSSILWTGRT